VPNKPLAFLLLLCLLPPALASAQDEFPPEPFSPDHYDRMAQRPPFVIPTDEEEAEEVVEPGWAEDFSIVSLLLVGDERVVLVKNRQTDQRFPVKAEENSLGIRLVELDLAEDPRDTTATIAMGEQVGTIRYDDDILARLPAPNVENNPAIQP